jgi:hypothetical protein
VLEIGSPLINGGFATQVAGGAQNGTVIVNSENNYTGGTIVNRASTLRFQDNGALGSGAISAFGAIVADGFGGTFINDAGTANLPVTLYGWQHSSVRQFCSHLGWRH